MMSSEKPPGESDGAAWDSSEGKREAREGDGIAGGSENEAALCEKVVDRGLAGQAGRERELLDMIAAREAALAARETALKIAVRDQELAKALSGRALVSGAVGQLVKLWADRFDVLSDGDAIRVAYSDGRPVDAVVSEWLEQEEYSHFCVPRTRGGAARQLGPGGVANGQATGPANLGEAIVQTWREAMRGLKHVQGPVGLGRRM